MRTALTRYIYYPLTQKVKGHRVTQYLSGYQTIERLNEDELSKIQTDNLRRTLEISAQTPYYKALFKKLEFKVEDADNFSALPITTKLDININPAAFHNPDYQGPLIEGRTSGTTGIALSVLYDSGWDQRNQAAQLHGRSWWKIYPGARELDIWGRAFDSQGSAWKAHLKLALMNKKMISCFQLSDSQLDSLTPKLAKFKPEVIYSYTTGVGRLAEYLWEKYGEDPPFRPRVVIITSETLLEPHRAALIRVFGSEPVNEYGAVEGGIIAFQCPEGGLHIFADRILLEIVEPDEVGFGRVVITPFLNRAMPLLRYDLGDLGRLVEGKCSCGRTMPLFELAEARVSDIVVTPRGKAASSTFFDFMAKSLIPYGLRQFRVIQKSKTKFLIQMVRPQGKDETVEKIVREQMGQFLGGKLEVNFDYLNELKPEESGKLRYFIREDF